jgi:peroxiredoxin
MKKFLILLLCLPLVTLAQTAPRPFIIEGKLDGYEDGLKVTLYKNGSQTEWTSSKLLKGKFTIKEKVADPVLAFLVVEGQERPIEVYVEPATISVKANKSHPEKAEISGSKSNKEFAEFTATFLPLVQQLNSLGSTLSSTLPGEERDKMMETYNGIQDKIQKELDKYVHEKSKSPVTPFVLNIMYQFKEDIALLESRYMQLDPSVRNSTSGKELASFIAEKKIGAVGTMAMDFTQPDTNGSLVSLSSFRGKYVLVDFWASWCGPCRTENPNVVENYKSFSSKNFTVLSVSLDRPGQKDKWLQAITNDNLTWTNVSDLQWWDNAVAKLYRIRSIPQNILVDPNGKIIAKNLRGPDLRSKLCEIFGCP